MWIAMDGSRLGIKVNSMNYKLGFGLVENV